MKRVILAIFDFIELYLAMAAFVVMFITFLIMIFYRYIFHAQMAGIYELNVISFMWCTVFNASYGIRSNQHISFEILFERLSEKWKLMVNVLGCFFVLVLFCVLLPHAYDSVMFLGGKRSPVLHIPFNILFFPFVIFVGLSIIHYAVLLIGNIQALIKLLGRKG